MILKTNGNFGKMAGRFMQVNPDGDIILTFEVNGSYFPARTSVTSTTTFTFIGQDNVSNKVYIDYNDGTGEHVYDFKASGSTRRLNFIANPTTTSPTDIAQTGTLNVAAFHFYQDLPVGVKNTVNDTYPVQRVIRLRFEKPNAVTQIVTQRIRLFNQLPSGFAKLVNLERLSISTAMNITSFPQDFYNSRIKNLTLSVVGDIMNAGFPNWILNSPIMTLNLSSSINLSGTAEQKKFNQINRLKDTLVLLDIGGSGINYAIPEEFNELYKLETLLIDVNQSTDLRMPNNLSGLVALQSIDASFTAMPFTEIERVVQNIPSLRILYIRNSGITTDKDFSGTNNTLQTVVIGGASWNSGAVPSFVNKLLALRSLSLVQVSGNISTSMNSWGNFANCVNLVTLTISRVSTMPTTIPSWFVNFTKLKNFLAAAAFGTTARVDAFTNNFYSFVVANAPMVGTSTSSFRSMTVDIYGTGTVDNTGSVRPTGTFQQPAGYVLGTNNGAPATPMEKIWVLTFQYGHVWTVKPA